MASKQTEKKCIFLINTEYVLLISVLYTKYHLDKNVTPIFVLIKNSDLRFSDIDSDALPGITYVYENEIHKNIIFPDTSYLDVVKLKNVTQVHFQNPQDMINSSLVSILLKNNPKIKITLISDSIAIDREILTKTRDRLIHYSKLYFRKYINGITSISSKVWSYHEMPFRPYELIAHKNYGYENFIDTKDLFKKINPSFEIISAIFKIDIEMFNKASIILFTQPNLNYSTYSAKIKRSYIEGVEQLCELAAKYRKYLIVKVHPAENPEIYKKYTNEFVTINESSGTPAEIIINGLENKKIVSYWSAISVYDVFNKHKHYWLYKTIGYNLKSDIPENIIVLNNLSEVDELIFDQKEKTF